MTTNTIKLLLGVEYDLCSLSGDVADLVKRLRAIPRPEARMAADELARLGPRLRRVLSRLDGPLTDAVRQAERAGLSSAVTA